MTTHRSLPTAFYGPRNAVIRGRIVTPSTGLGPFPGVVMLPGDGPKGIKSETWVKLPDMLAHRGLATFVFDFEGLGESEGDRRNLSLTVGLEDLRAAMAFVRARDEFDPNRIGLFGSSFGGNVAVLYANEDPKLRCVGLKSPVSFYPDSFLCELGVDSFERWLRERFSPKLGFDLNFYMDALQYNTYAAASNIGCPCLVTHGSADETVPISQSRHLKAAMQRSVSCELRILNGVGHSYSEPGAWATMANAFASWFPMHI